MKIKNLNYLKGIFWDKNDWGTNCDYPGSDIASFTLSTPLDCNNKCLITTGCTFWVHAGTLCWIKNGTITKNMISYVPTISVTCGFRGLCNFNSNMNFRLNE